MADFTTGFWSWFIASVTIISILALTWLTIRLMGRKLSEDEQAASMGHEWDEGLQELNNPLPRWWVNLFLITLVWGLIYLFLYPGLGSFKGYLGWSQESQYQAEMDTADRIYGPIFEKYADTELLAVAVDAEALSIGKSLFSTYCTTCHGSDAGGARGYPSLKDNDWLYGGNPEQIKQSILNGRQGIMMAWEPILDREKIFNVAEYVRAMAGHNADPVTASLGKEIYTVNCQVCHAENGGGNQGLGAPDLTDDIWLYGGSQKRIIESITAGRNGNMPPHKEFLGEAKAHLLAAYVYSLSNQE